MANYDLTYEGSRVQNILDTGDELRDAGYIFRGEATPSTVPGTPTERVAYIGGPGTYTNFGSSITVGAGCICVFKYTGSAWSNQVINTGLSAAISNEATTRSQADTALQNAINAINTKLGEGYIYAGLATPSTNPGAPTGKVFYLTAAPGTYTNFGNAEVTAGLNVIKYNGSVWSVDQVIAIDAEPTQGSANLVKSGGVLNSIIQNGPAFDISAYNAQGGTLATYADLSAALTALNALPADFKKGGMSMKFVLTSDNKYVQYFLNNPTFTTNIAKWQGVNNRIAVMIVPEDIVVDKVNLKITIPANTMIRYNDFNSLYNFDTAQEVTITDSDNHIILFDMEQKTLSRVGWSEDISSLGKKYAVCNFIKLNGNNVVYCLFGQAHSTNGNRITSFEQLYIENNLTSNAANRALSANMGLKLSTMIGRTAIMILQSDIIVDKVNLKIQIPAATMIKYDSYRLTYSVDSAVEVPITDSDNHIILFDTENKTFSRVGWSADISSMDKKYAVCNFIRTNNENNVVFCLFGQAHTTNGNRITSFEQLYIENNLTSNAANRALSANMGLKLSTMIGRTAIMILQSDIIVDKVNLKIQIPAATMIKYDSYRLTYSVDSAVEVPITDSDNHIILFDTENKTFSRVGWSADISSMDKKYAVCNFIRTNGNNVVFCLFGQAHTTNGNLLTSMSQVNEKLANYTDIEKHAKGIGNTTYYGIEKLNINVAKFKYTNTLLFSRCSDDRPNTYPQVNYNYAQSSAIYDGILFSFLENSGYAFIFNLLTKEDIGYAALPLQIKANSAQFTNVFYNNNDRFPLLAITRCDSTGKVDILRVQESSNVFTFSQIKSIEIDIATFKEGGGSVCIDIVRNKLIVAYKKDATAGATSPVCFATFPLPDITNASDVTYTNADIENYFELPYFVIQGNTYDNGNIYQAGQLRGDYYYERYGIYRNACVVLVIDAVSGLIKNIIPVSEYEPEGVIVYDNCIYVQSVKNPQSSPSQDSYFIYQLEF